MSTSCCGNANIQESSNGRQRPHRRLRRRWPAEWEPHDWTVLFAPHNPETFVVDAAMPQFIQIVQTLSKIGQERVLLLVKDDQTAQRVLSSLSYSQSDQDSTHCCSVTTVLYHSNDSWARDTAPTFVLEEDNQSVVLVGLDWEFNAYGGETEGCYWPCQHDRELAGFVCRTLQQQQPHQHQKSIVLHERIPELVLEGGAIHTDGQGTILVTRECLMNPNRNPHLSQWQIEEFLLSATGCVKVIWLEHGLAYDDDTNGHIDNFGCFVQPTHVVLAWTDDESTDAENYRRCRDAYSRLSQSTDAQENYLHIHKLYLPRPQYYNEHDICAFKNDGPTDPNTTTLPRTLGGRMAASYVNFYVANAAVLVPQFGDPERDRDAIRTLEPFFPDRTVVGISSRAILVGGGNIHCITQQIPRIR
jgi:agmatine deiminase